MCSADKEEKEQGKVHNQEKCECGLRLNETLGSRNVYSVEFVNDMFSENHKYES